MNIYPGNKKYDQIFSHKGLFRPYQNDPGQSPGKKFTFCEVLIVQFNNYLSFRAWLLLYITISKLFQLTKCKLAKAWSDPPQPLRKSCFMGLR